MNDLYLDRHISQQFNQDLENIRSDMLEMGGMVENQVANAVRALVDGNTEVAEQVLKVEEEINQREIKIDEECTHVLARRQPAATDLRLVLAVSKIILDLERVGDEANKIAEFAIALTEKGESPRGYVEVRHIGNLVHQMLCNSLDAFARFDVDKAIAVVKDDKIVDQEYGTALRELMTYMMEDPRSITLVMRIVWVLRALERIGDHARNIAEQLIYLVKGKDVRHLSLDELEQKIASGL
jgi:phosphate transport system protein